MEDFFIDKVGYTEEENVKIGWSDTDGEEDDADVNYIDALDELSDVSEDPDTKLKEKNKFDLSDTYIISSYSKSEKKEIIPSNLDKIIKKSSIKPGLEQQFAIDSKKSKKLLKLERKKLRERTKGKNWFNIPATEVTPEIKNDFKALKMRSALDRKHMYKKNNITAIPKYFQVGTVVESPADFYNGRIVKSQRKKTIVEELLADAEFKNYQKKKFKEIVRKNSFRRKKR